METVRRDVAQVLEELPFGTLRALILGLVTFTIILDGLDIQLAALAAPAILAEWRMDKAAMGPVLAASLAGMAIGTALGGYAGDRWGRRPSLIAAIIAFGLCTALSALASGPWTLAGLRLLTGIGLGAAVPNATALVTEWMQVRWRAYAVMLVIVAVPIGGMIGAALCAWMIPLVGWRACFVLGGVLPLLLAVLMIISLPESPQFLASRAGGDGRLAALLNQLANKEQFDSGMEFNIRPTPDRSAGLPALLHPSLRRATLGLWLGFFAAMLVLYGCLNWLPTLLRGLGLPLDQAVRGSMWFNLGGIGGAMLGAWVGGRMGPVRALGGLCLAGSAILVGAGLTLILVPAPLPLPLVVAILLAGGAVLGVQVGLYGLAAAAYPTACRAAGIGWAASIGRGGAVVSALAGGAVLGLPNGPTWLLLGLGMALLLCRSIIIGACRNSFQST